MVNGIGKRLLIFLSNSGGSSDWFSDNQDNANVASWALTFLSAAEHAAEITDGAGSGAYFKVIGKVVFWAGAVYNVNVIREAVNNKDYNLAIKTGFDTGFSAVMTFGGIPGLVIGVVYFGVDMFVPGGWGTVSKNQYDMYMLHVQDGIMMAPWLFGK